MSETQPLWLTHKCELSSLIYSMLIYTWCVAMCMCGVQSPWITYTLSLTANAVNIYVDMENAYALYCNGYLWLILFFYLTFSNLSMFNYFLRGSTWNVFPAGYQFEIIANLGQYLKNFENSTFSKDYAIIVQKNIS